MHLITGSARVAGVIGHPIGHSMSPLLHNYWFQTHQIDGVYIPLDVAPIEVNEVVPMLKKAGLKGLNVTIPHKERVALCVDELSDEARLIGAANTLLFRDDGSTLGLNTDGIGFMQNLREQAPALALSRSKVMIIGAGGAARSIAYALLKNGAHELCLTNRTKARAEALAEQLTQIFPNRLTVEPWDHLEKKFDEVDLLVNSTSAGMKGEQNLEIDLSPLPRHAVVADIVYNPLMTDLLKKARACQLTTVDGLGMLLHQAVPGFEHWGGCTPKIDLSIRQLITDKLGL